MTFESREAFGEISKDITVRTNADNSVTVLKLTAFIRTDLYIHKFVQFGKVQRGTTVERKPLRPSAETSAIGAMVVPTVEMTRPE